ncbi:MAG: NAD-binding protein [Chloroflexota bacterium]
MFVLIAGGGRTGTQLAYLLIEQNHQVRVVEHRREVLSRLHRELPTEIIYEGNATELEVLEHAGIHQANVLAACTSLDEDNLVICFLARERFKVRRTIARINNPRNAWLFDEKFHVDVALNHSAVMASLIEEEMSLGDMVTLTKLRRGDYSLVEEKIPAGAPGIGIPLKDLGLVDSCVIAAIIRNGKVVAPRGNIAFDAGDEIFAITDRKGAEQLRNLFAPGQTTD